MKPLGLMLLFLAHGRIQMLAGTAVGRPERWYRIWMSNHAIFIVIRLAVLFFEQKYLPPRIWVDRNNAPLVAKSKTPRSRRSGEWETETHRYSSSSTARHVDEVDNRIVYP